MTSSIKFVLYYQIWDIEDIVPIWQIRLPGIIRRHDYSIVIGKPSEYNISSLQNLAYNSEKNALVIQYGDIVGTISLYCYRNHLVDFSNGIKDLFRAWYRLKYEYKHLITSDFSQQLVYLSSSLTNLLVSETRLFFNFYVKILLSFLIVVFNYAVLQTLLAISEFICLTKQF